MKTKSLLNKIDTILAAGLLTASIVVVPSAQASDWNGASGNWTSTVSPGWTVGGVPDAVGAVANKSSIGTVVTTQNVGADVIVGTISLAFNGSSNWTFTLTNGITLNQDGAGSGSATISNTNTSAATTNYILFESGTLTLADNLLISNTGASTRSAANGGSIGFQATSVIAGTGNITIDNVLNDTVAGVGSIRFAAATHTFTGNVNVRSGGTTYGGGSVFGNAANVITLGASGAGSASLLGTAGGTVVNNWVVAAESGGTLTLGAINTNGQTWSGTGTLNGDLTLFTLASSSNKFRLDGVISGTGNFTMSSSGAGYAEMSQANTYTGSTSVSSGILSLANASALQNSALDTTASVTGTTTAGLRAGGVTTLTLGGLTGNKNLADVFATGAGPSAGLYSNVAALTLNPGTGVTHTYSAGIANGAANMTLTKTGNGTQILEGTNGYTGNTTVSAGTLLLSSTGSLAAGSAVTVQTGAAIGGDGTINGNLTLDSGAKFVFDLNDNPLTVAGTFALASTFGVDDLVTSSLGAIDWSTVGVGTYTLIGTGFSFNSGNIQNFGSANAYSSGGKLMHFENGSLDLVVALVPEPSTFALLAFSLTTITVLRRRRRS